MYSIQQGLIKDPETLTSVMDSCGNCGLVGEKTTVAETYLAVSKLFDTVSLKIVPSKMNFF